jgi:hypothetical protein
MVRQPRVDLPNAVYHPTSRSKGRGVIFWSEDDRQRFLAELAGSQHMSSVQSKGPKELAERPARCQQGRLATPGQAGMKKPIIDIFKPLLIG